LVIANNLPDPFEPLDDPGDCPDLPADTYVDRFKINDVKLVRYQREEAAVLKFTEALVNALDPASQRLVADPGGGATILTRSLRDIVGILAAKYSRVPPAKLGKVFDKLRTPFPPGTDVLAYLAAQTETHRILAINLEDVAEPMKIRLALEALIAGGGQAFAHAYGTYEDSCRTARDAQGQPAPTRMDWEGFSDAMVAASQRLPESSTVGNAGFGGAVSGPPTDNETYGHTSIAHDQSPAFAAAVSKEVAKRMEQSKGARERGRGGGAGAGPPRTPLLYCFSHGYQHSHTSLTCRNPWKTEHDEHKNAKGHGCHPSASSKGDPAGKAT
jgi:hypothetical protein